MGVVEVSACLSDHLWLKAIRYHRHYCSMGRFLNKLLDYCHRSYGRLNWRRSLDTYYLGWSALTLDGVPWPGVLRLSLEFIFLDIEPLAVELGPW